MAVAAVCTHRQEKDAEESKLCWPSWSFSRVWSRRESNTGSTKNRCELSNKRSKIVRYDLSYAISIPQRAAERSEAAGRLERERVAAPARLETFRLEAERQATEQAKRARLEADAAAAALEEERIAAEVRLEEVRV